MARLDDNGLHDQFGIGRLPRSMLDSAAGVMMVVSVLSRFLQLARKQSRLMVAITSRGIA